MIQSKIEQIAELDRVEFESNKRLDLTGLDPEKAK